MSDAGDYHVFFQRFRSVKTPGDAQKGAGKAGCYTVATNIAATARRSIRAKNIVPTKGKARRLA